MATSPNFSWPEPDNTDLVKNGALAIRTAINAIDTSMAELKGGTTGQVLSKTSNTDMDFTWVAQDDSNAIQNALLTTTGDTIYASSASTPARRAIGTTGQVLTVSGGLPVWATPSGGGGMTLLSTTTLSGASTTISSIDQTYTNLYAFIVGMTNATADGNFIVRPNNLTSAYYGTTLTGSTFGTIAGGGVNFPVQARANVSNIYTLKIPSYANPYAGTSVNRIVVQAGGSCSNGDFQTWGVLATGSAVTSLVFLNGGGNFSTGTVLLYGVK